MNMVAERPGREERRKYATGLKREALYKAATKLWVKGLGMAEAISIVESAMRDAGEIWSCSALNIWNY